MSVHCIGTERTTPSCGTQYSPFALAHLTIWRGDEVNIFLNLYCGNVEVSVWDYCWL
jgi:hypothetical protein